MPKLTYYASEIDEATRKSLTPSMLDTYLATPTTTPTIPAGTPTVVTIPTTVKAIRDFELREVTTGVYAYYNTGTVARQFKLDATTSMQTGTNNVIVRMSMGINGSIVDGCSISRKVATGSDTGALGLTSFFELQPNDYLQVFLETDLDSTVTFIDTVINLFEK